MCVCVRVCKQFIGWVRIRCSKFDWAAEIFIFFLWEQRLWGSTETWEDIKAHWRQCFCISPSHSYTHAHTYYHTCTHELLRTLAISPSDHPARNTLHLTRTDAGTHVYALRPRSANNITNTEAEWWWVWELPLSLRNTKCCLIIHKK